MGEENKKFHTPHRTRAGTLRLKQELGVFFCISDFDNIANESKSCFVGRNRHHMGLMSTRNYCHIVWASTQSMNHVPNYSRNWEYIPRNGSAGCVFKGVLMDIGAPDPGRRTSGQLEGGKPETFMEKKRTLAGPSTQVS